MLEIRRRLGDRVLSQLRSEIAGISAHLGEDYENSTAPEAVKYREIGGKFAWLAFGFAPWRFWDLHVGVVEADETHLRLGFHISERAEPALKPELEKLASEIGTTVIHQERAVEYQANYPPSAASASNIDPIAERIVFLCRRFAKVAQEISPSAAMSITA